MSTEIVVANREAGDIENIQTRYHDESADLILKTDYPPTKTISIESKKTGTSVLCQAQSIGFFT